MEPLIESQFSINIPLVVALVAMFASIVAQIIITMRANKELKAKLEFERYQYNVSTYEKLVESASSIIGLVNGVSINHRDFIWKSATQKLDEEAVRDHLHSQFNLLTDIAKPMFKVNVYVASHFSELEDTLKGFSMCHMETIKTYLEMRDSSSESIDEFYEKIAKVTKEMGESVTKLQGDLSKISIET